MWHQYERSELPDFGGEISRTDHIEGLDVDRRIIIKWIEEIGVGVSGLDLSLIILLVP